MRSLGGLLGAGRRDRTKGQTSMNHFCRPVSESEAFQKLVKDKMLIRRKRCPLCGISLRNNLRPSMTPLRCSRPCRCRYSMWEDHPILYTMGRSESWTRQSTLLLMILHGVPNHHIHGLMDIPHATIERAKSNFRAHIAQYVTKQQQLIQLGLPGVWSDI